MATKQAPESLNKMQAMVLQEVRENPGIEFGIGTRKAKTARQLRERGLLTWDYRFFGWYAAIAKASPPEGGGGGA